MSCNFRIYFSPKLLCWASFLLATCRVPFASDELFESCNWGMSSIDIYSYRTVILQHERDNNWWKRQSSYEPKTEMWTKYRSYTLMYLWPLYRYPLELKFCATSQKCSTLCKCLFSYALNSTNSFLGHKWTKCHIGISAGFCLLGMQNI